MLFVLGSLAYVWRKAFPVSLIAGGDVALLVAVYPVALPATRCSRRRHLRRTGGILSSARPVAPFNRIGDYSYGLYVYAFPIQQTVVQRAPAIEPLTLFARRRWSTLIVSAASWHVVEKPALGRNPASTAIHRPSP